MWFLTIVTYLALIVQICFTTVAIAAGLYYLAELVEEYTTVSKKIIWWLNTISVILYIGLWVFEDFPLHMIVCGILAQFAHYSILTNFPCFTFTSPSFIISVMFVMINHYLAFIHFIRYSYSFTEVTAYFTLYLWLVPFALFVSLTANENVLPTTTDANETDLVSNYFSKRNKKYGLLTFFNFAKESILPQRSKKGF